MCIGRTNHNSEDNLKVEPEVVTPTIKKEANSRYKLKLIYK